MSHIIFLACLLVTLASHALAWDEPSGFRNLPWGSSIVTVQDKLPSLTCMQESCFGELYVGSVKTHANLVFCDLGLDKVVLVFPGSSYSTLKPIFIERYGPPTGKSTEELQNRMGARFENEILLWMGQKANVRLERYRYDLANGAATIETKAGAEERARKDREREQEGTRKGKKDL